MPVTETNAPVKTADLDLIQQILPHRYPFLFLDRVDNIEYFVEATGTKNVTINEPFFQGHFPGTPIMPGVTIVEAMAQTAAVLVGLSLDVVERDLLVYFMSIDKCKFRRKVVPGDVLKMHMTVLRSGAKVWRFQGLATVDGETVCQAEITAMLELQDEDPKA